MRRPLRLMEDCAGLLASAARAAGATDFAWMGRVCDPFEEPQIISVCDAFATHASIDLEPLLDDRDGLARAAARDGIRVVEDDGWSDLFYGVGLWRRRDRHHAGRRADGIYRDLAGVELDVRRARWR